MTDRQLADLSMTWAKAFARKLSLARHIVDELAQEAAIGILRARQSHDEKKGGFEAYAQRWAWHFMRRHTNKYAGPVNHAGHVAGSVSLISPEADENTPGMRDDRTVRSLAVEGAEWNETFNRLDPLTQLMVAQKAQGATNQEIGDGLGLSREYVRKRVVAFAAELEVA